jgi:DNA-binding Lrp family transcriptional regulator
MHNNFQERIIAILRGSPNGLTSNEITELLGPTAKNMSSRLSKLAAYGIIGKVRCYLDLPAKQIGDRGSRAAIWHMCQINAGHHLEQFTGNVSRAPIAARAHADLAGIGLKASQWVGLCAPKNTPPEIIGKLNTEINSGLADPKLKARLADLGGMVLAGSPADFGKLIADDTEKWGKVVKLSGAKPE